MAGIIDCAVLLHAAEDDWPLEWIRSQTAAQPKLRLHACPLPFSGTDGASMQALGEARLVLRRFDVAILPVSYASLSSIRTVLAGGSHVSTLPVRLLALGAGLKAPAILDLFDLGVADFVRDDASADELRARVTRLSWTQQMQDIASPDATDWARAERPQLMVNDRVLMDSATLILPGAGVTLREPGSQTYPARSKADEPFRVAKSRVVDSFERDYIARALSRHAGNISMAARSAHKHRRAFWALMRKHRIDAGLYRDTSQEHAD